MACLFQLFFTIGIISAYCNLCKLFFSQLAVKIDENTPLNDELLLQAADSLDLFASQFIKDTVRRNVSFWLFHIIVVNFEF